ncbi:hypothetical protein BGZ65_008055 [Modicella reniformis]|uniref:Uncharacterized protein n=1 Tax=Modicella reniformis TaxID=1440133 RepID=A0A9P6LS32_9FUNG|nr:hypothetical protein BGZ65_008055 [Modicella reniformis]
MAKRPLTPAVDQPLPPQKAQRTDDDGTNTEAGNLEGSLLITKLTYEIFGVRPKKPELRAMDYLESLMSLSAPTPKTSDYLAFMRVECPAVPEMIVARAWNMIKRHLGDTKKEDYLGVDHLFDIGEFLAAFKEVPEIDESEMSTAAAAAMPPPHNMATPDAAASSSRSSKAPTNRSRSNSMSNSGNSSSGHPSQGQIMAMKSLFKANFNKFQGTPWSLPSGTVFDDHLCEAIMGLEQETALHSFIIEDVGALLQLFEVEMDQDKIRSAMVTPQGKGLLELSGAEAKYLDQFNKPRDELVEFIADQSWRSVAKALEDKPSTEFQKVAYWCVAPGEVHSEASAHRRNKQRTCQERQQVGHKVDGMVVFPARSLEILYMETVKKDSGVNSTKYLHDTKKLFKLKDAHDAIRERTATLHQHPGRFYQAIPEVTMSLSPVWMCYDKDTTIGVIAWVLRLRKTILAVTESAFKWTSLPKDGQRPGDHDDRMAPTMTSPQLLPTTPAILDEVIPPLVLFLSLFVIHYHRALYICNTLYQQIRLVANHMRA